MWSPWLSATPVYLARGITLVEQRGQSSGARVQTFQCEPGQEIEQLAGLVRERSRERFQILAGPGFVVLGSMSRVAGVWRQAERDRAAKALAGFDPREFGVATADPSPDSAWVINSYISSALQALRRLDGVTPGRLRGVVSYAGFVLSTLLSRRTRVGLDALMEDGHLTWSVGDRSRLVAMGTVNGLPLDQAPVECARLALAHGLSPGAIRIVRMRMPEPGIEPATGSSVKPAARVPISVPFCALLHRANEAA